MVVFCFGVVFVAGFLFVCCVFFVVVFLGGFGGLTFFSFLFLNRTIHLNDTLRIRVYFHLQTEIAKTATASCIKFSVQKIHCPL